MVIMDKKDIFKRSILELQKIDSESAYLVFADKNSEKFVQFAGGKNQKLIFDLPRLALNESEFEKAKYIASEFHIQSSESGFSQEIEIDDAVELTYLIFLEVYNLDKNFAMEVELAD
jgi:hypothetical protein